MKKFILVFAAVAALMMSCQTEEEKAGSLSGEGYQFDFTIAPGGFENTKGDATVGWTAGEKVYVFFKPEGGELLGDSYAEFTYTGIGWSPKSYVAPGALGTSGKMAAVYVPYFDGKSPVYTGNKWTFDSGDVYYSCASGADYAVEEGTVTGTLSMRIPDGYIQFAMASASEGDVLACNIVDGYEDVTLSSDLVFSTTPVDSKKMNGHADNGRTYFWGKVNGAAAAECEFTLTTASGDVTVKVPAANVFKNNAFNLSTLDEALADDAVDAVEIGGVSWASMNLGATTVAGSLATCAGNYYQWGSVNTLYGTIDSWTPPSATWKEGKESGYVAGNLEYSGSDATLPAANDVVKAELGDGWRMPTSAEFMALYNACGGSYDKTTYATAELGDESVVSKGVYWCGNYDGVAGCLFCDGTNKLFFPAAGYFNGTELLVAGAGSDYWSGEFSAGSGKPYCWAFDSNDVYPQIANERHYGFSVRPVKVGSAPALPEGVLAGKFSVSATKKVHFSKGNLWADSNKALHFESNQYSSANSWDASHVSHFTWSSTVEAAVGNSNSGDNLFCDESHKVSVDGSEAIYYALSKDEWTYLFSNHSYKWASVNGVNGFVIAPDGFSGELANTYADDAALAANNLVFLPVASYRYGADVSSVDDLGYYWSSTAYDRSYAYSVYFRSSNVSPDNGGSRLNGFCVRLITDASAGGDASEVKVTGVTLNKTELSLTVGGNETLTATVAPENATDKSVTWSSDSEAVATVDNTGKVTAVSAGTATITVTTADGSKTATCTVTVTKPSLPMIAPGTKPFTPKEW